MRPSRQRGVLVHLVINKVPFDLPKKKEPWWEQKVVSQINAHERHHYRPYAPLKMSKAHR